MALSTEDAAALVSLRAAYRQLISGQLVAKVTAFGRTVEYGAANLKELKAEIERLEALDASTTGLPARRRGAITFRVN